MRGSCRVLALAWVLTLIACPAAAQEVTGRTITVEGQAEIRVVPDEVLLTLGVETVSTDIAAARAENDRRIAAIVAAARKAGVAQEHIQTEFLEIEPRYKDGWTRQDFVGYLARRSLTIRLRTIAAFESLLTDTIAAGANYVHGVDFRTSELRRHRDQARRLALVAAREKATAMAESLGQRIGAASRIQEGHSGWWSPYGRWWGARGGGMSVQNVVQELGRMPSGADALVAGQISVTASVNVTFELTR